jgi:hypothetical protein
MLKDEKLFVTLDLLNISTKQLKDDRVRMQRKLDEIFTTMD